MAQLLFKAQLRNRTLTTSPFYFNDGSTGHFSNVLKINRFQNVLTENKTESGDTIDLVSILDVNTFLHTISKTRTSDNQQQLFSFVDLGTQVVAIEFTADLINITLSKSVKQNGYNGDEFIFCFQEFFNKSKKGAVGLNATRPQKVTALVPLYSTVGEKLSDDFGNELVAESEIALVDKIQAANALRVNITPGNFPNYLKIEEQFPSISEVSSTLLGIPRAETQLSLFSDVSTLGFDDLTWETFKSLRRRHLTNHLSVAWENRKTRDSQRFNARMNEVINEQALELSAFPVPYLYPYDETSIFYNESQFTKFYKFILLGNYLYRYFELSNLPYKDDFLNPAVVTVNENDGVLRNTGEENDSAIQLMYTDQDAAFRLIDIWTDTFIKLRDGNYANASASQVFTALYGTQFTTITGYLSDFTNIASDVVKGLPSRAANATRQGLEKFYQPGYSWGDNGEETIVLQTKEVFRYQPGRISGFTFGSRTDVVSSGGGTIVEWGVENNTDAYLFRLTGGNLSIVRKSTVPLSSKFLEDEGLVGRQEKIVDEIDRFTGLKKDTQYELELNQTDWNQDPLNGNGPSGYVLDASHVTMWKIEFSWYGAIGARFYAYIPVENNEARWVLVHTLVIENKLIQACLEDPYFRMKYAFTLRNRERSPRKQFIYKYGSSVYIDGGDEGTKKQFSYTGDKKTSIENVSVPLLGIKPKLNIKNRDEISIPNRKIGYPELLNVNASEFTKFQVLQCEACPGFAYTYDNGLISTEPAEDPTVRKINFHIHKITGNLLDGTPPTQYIRISDVPIDLHDSPDLEDNIGFRPDDHDSQVLIPGFGKRYIDYFSTLEDFKNSSENDKDEFLFADSDGLDPEDVIDNTEKTLTSSVQFVSFDIDDNVTNLFDISTGAPIQIKCNINAVSGNTPDENMSVVLQDASGNNTSDELQIDDSPNENGIQTFRLISTAPYTSKVLFKTTSSGSTTDTNIQILAARIAEFKMSRVLMRGMNSIPGVDRELVEKTPVVKNPIFLRGSASLQIGHFDEYTSAINFENNEIEERVKIILEAENSSYTAGGPITEQHLSEWPFRIKRNAIVINRTYFNGDYADSPQITIPYKEYTWFIGNRAILSSIKKNYAVSSVTIGSQDAEMRFLNIGKRTYNTDEFLIGSPTAEFRIAFTDIDPADEPNKIPREENLLYADYDRRFINQWNGYERLTGSSDGHAGNEIIETFQVDYRVKEIPSDPGTTNGGLCSLVKISAAAKENYGELEIFNDKTALSERFEELMTQEDYPSSIFDIFENYTNLLVIEDQGFLNTVFDENNGYRRIINFKNGEMGLNSQASGITFATEPLYFQYVENDIENKACVVALSDSPSPNISEEDEITLSFVQLEYTFNNTGASFRSEKKIFGFDPFPLYPIIFTRCGSKINNINFKKGNVVASPIWNLYGQVSISNPLETTDPGYIANADAGTRNSENFEIQDKLSGLLVDKSANKRLRKIFTPGDPSFGNDFKNGATASRASSENRSSRVKILTSFYAGGGEDSFDTNSVDLTDVFGEDRFKIIQDIRNSKALFIVGEQPSDDSPKVSGTFQASLNTSEI